MRWPVNVLPLLHVMANLSICWPICTSAVLSLCCAVLCRLQATAAEYSALAVEAQKAQTEFSLKYKGKKRYIFIGPLFAIVQAVIFISQFSAINTLAHYKVSGTAQYGTVLCSTAIGVRIPASTYP